MRHIVIAAIATLALAACGGGGPPVESPETVATGPGESDDFVLRDSAGTAKAAHGATPSKIKATATEAAMKFFVVDEDKGPVKGIVVALTAPDGQRHFTDPTDETGYAEVLVPVGKKYDLVYLALGKKDVAAGVEVTDEPRQNIKLTLHYKRVPFAPPAPGAPDAPRFVLDGVNFDTGKATIRPESFPRLDGVVEYLTYSGSSRIEISGHTDNVGNKKSNRTLSEKRAKACREYMVSKGIDGGRIEAVGYGDERPIAPNDTDEGRQRNRRIEVTEL
jgi:outer membrane protein OmpA-like peptidoglycan-associated protein